MTFLPLPFHYAPSLIVISAIGVRLVSRISFLANFLICHYLIIIVALLKCLFTVNLRDINIIQPNFSSLC